MRKSLYVVLGLALAVIAVSCTTLQPKTLTNAVVVHSSFPALSVMVQDCIKDEPELIEAVTPAFNQLVDTWEYARDVPQDQILTKALASPAQLMEAKTSWVFIKTAIIDAGVDCGPAVRDIVSLTENTFTELASAVESNERAVYFLEWAKLIGSIVNGRDYDITRI